MRRRGLLIAGWATATVLAVVVGLLGVSAISDSVVGERRSVLTESNVKARLDRHASSSSSSAASAASSSAAESSASSSPQDAGQSASTSGATDDGGGSSSSSSPPDTTPPSVTTSSSDDGGSSSSSSAPASAPVDETYTLIGGTVSVRFENGEAHLLFASPAAGYDVENQSGATEVDIRFHGEDHESRLRAFWNNGPQHTIDESNDD